MAERHNRQYSFDGQVLIRAEGKARMAIHPAGHIDLNTCDIEAGEIEKYLDQLPESEGDFLVIIPEGELERISESAIARAETKNYKMRFDTNDYREYVIGDEYSFGEVLSFEDMLYLVVMPGTHRAQADWVPGQVPALYSPLHYAPGAQIPDIPDWQPYVHGGKTYQVGDIVTHKGRTWECMSPDNHWEPDSPGIDERYWKEVNE